MGLIQGKSGDTGHSEFQNILSASERAKALTLKLLTFSRKEKINVKTVCVCDMIHDLTSMLERTLSKKIKIKTTVNDAISISVDANQIQQALINICNNACDAMPDGGVLAIECIEVAPDPAYCANHLDIKPGHYCVIQISDTGTGIPRDMLKKVVDPFFTTKGPGKGTGLGLSVSFGIIRSHGGAMHIYSEPGRGTIVKIYLPVAESPAESCRKVVTYDLKRGSETLMLVDDEINILEIAKKILVSAGYTVAAFSSPIEAVEYYRAHWNEISLVALDMIMPEMDGGEVFSALHEINPDVNVMLSSGYSLNGQAGKLMKEGIKGFIQKPYGVTELCTTIRDLLDKS
jgi:CheY-like chemotaxis protein